MIAHVIFKYKLKKEAQARSLGVQGHPRLHSEIKASFGCTRAPWQDNNQDEQELLRPSY